MKKAVRALLLSPVLLLLLFEEWGWQPLARAFAALAGLPWWGQLEQRIIRLPPWASLLVFGVPVAALVPIKLLALYLFGRGHVALGLCMIVMVKLAGTAIAARLFQLTQPALMRMPWFARLYTPWKRWKDQLLDRARASRPWQLARRLKSRIKVIGRMGWRQIKSVWASDTS